MDSEIGGKVGDQGILETRRQKKKKKETRRQIYFNQEKVITCVRCYQKGQMR